jgi:hypothetical protein
MLHASEPAPHSRRGRKTRSAGARDAVADEAEAIKAADS